MIVRTWSAQATPANVAAYLHHFRASVAPALGALPGFVSALVRQRTHEVDGEARVEIVVDTRWESMDAIRRFAGDDVEIAVVEPAAAAVLEQYDRRVAHYEIVYDG